MGTPITAVVDPITGLFCENGMMQGRITIVVSDNPDARLQRYSGDPANPVRKATAQEIAVYDAAALDAKVMAIMTPEQKTFVLWALTRFLGHSPSPQEFGTAKAEIGAIYKTVTGG